MVEAVRKHKRILQTGSHVTLQPDEPLRLRAGPQRPDRPGQAGASTNVGYNNKVGPGTGLEAHARARGLRLRDVARARPQVPYHQDRCLYRFRFNYDYSGGQVTNFGAHSNDMAQWGLGTDDTGPVEIEVHRRQVAARREPVQHGPGDRVPLPLRQRRGTGLPDAASDPWRAVRGHRRHGRNVGLSLAGPQRARIADRPAEFPDGKVARRRHIGPRAEFPRLRQEPAGTRSRRSKSVIARPASATWATSPSAWDAT